MSKEEPDTSEEQEAPNVWSADQMRIKLLLDEISNLSSSHAAQMTEVRLEHMMEVQKLQSAIQGLQDQLQGKKDKKP